MAEAMTDKNRTKRRNRLRKLPPMPPTAQRESIKAWLGDCGGYVIITTEKRRNRGTTHHQHR
jgi:hypothetical protein